MIQSNIGVGVHYLSLAQHPYYQDRFGWQPEDFPVAERYGLATVSLPLSAKLTEAEIDRIISTVTRLVEG
jgi:dTDP-4-amino-4,6-dideoxygalactose transaminase